MTQPTAPSPLDDVFMPDNACMVQVYRLDPDGLVNQLWVVMMPYVDVCEQVSGLFGQPFGGGTATAEVAAQLYTVATSERDAGNAQVVEYDQ